MLNHHEHGPDSLCDEWSWTPRWCVAAKCLIEARLSSRPGDTGFNTRCLGVVKKPRRDLNSRPLPYQGSALPLSYKGMCGWAGLDLNQRRQSQRIYRSALLTTRAPTRTQDGTLPAHAHRSGATPLLAWGSQAVCTDQLLQHRQHFMTRHAFSRI